MKKMYPLIRNCLQEYIETLELSTKQNKEIDLKEMNANYTMDVVAKCAFATTTNAHKDSNNLFMTHAKSIFNFKIWKILFIGILPTFLLRLIGIKSLVSSESIQFFFDTTRYIIRKRRENKEKHNDLLQFLMDAERSSSIVRDENDVNEAHYVNEGLVILNF